MKTLLRLSLTLSIFATAMNAGAETIYAIKDGVSIFASTLLGSSGDYYDQNFTDLSSPINSTTLASDATGSNLTTYAWSPESHMPSGDGSAYLDIGFDQAIYNGDGADLVLFFAGNGTQFKDGHTEGFTFSLDVGIDGGIDIINSGVITSTSSDLYGDQFYASYAIIDLGSSFNGTDPLGNLRIFMDNSSMPALAAVGAYHLSPTVVPVPAAALLFASGLPLLAFFRRKAS